MPVDVKSLLNEYIIVLITAQFVSWLGVSMDLISISLFTYSAHHLTYSDLAETISAKVKKLSIYFLQALIVAMDIHSFYEVLYLQERTFLMLFIHLYASFAFYALDQFLEHLEDEQ